MNKKLETIVCFLLSMMFFIGCSTGGTKPDQAAGTTERSYEKYKQDRPEAKNIPSGIASVDNVANGIAGLYGTTISLTDQTISRMDNSPTALKLEALRDKLNGEGKDGEKAYQDAVKALAGKDKKEYEAYINGEINSLSVVGGYLLNATKLAVSIAQFNPQSLVSNPFAIVGVFKSIKLATSQVGFAIEALGWMNDYSDRLEAAKALMGR